MCQGHQDCAQNEMCMQGTCTCKYCLLIAVNSKGYNLIFLIDWVY